MREQGPALIGSATVALADSQILSGERSRAEVLALSIMALGDAGRIAFATTLADLAGRGVSSQVLESGGTVAAEDVAARLWGGSATREGLHAVDSAVHALVLASRRQEALSRAAAAGAGFPSVAKGWVRQLADLLAVSGQAIRGTGTAAKLAEACASISRQSAEVEVLE
jgi:hypothetical protein